LNSHGRKCMHELGIAQEMISSLEDALLSHPGLRITSVRIRVGTFQNVEKDSLRFSFEVLSKDNPRIAGAKLHIEDVAAEYSCRACNSRGELEGFFWVCPSCGDVDIRVKGGDELILQSIEGEDESNERKVKHGGDQNREEVAPGE